MNAFTIKDLENLSGIKAHTIRIWEQRYHFLKPQRTSTNIRYYSNAELKTLLNVSLLNKYGFKISHIDKMPEAEMEQHIGSLVDVKATQERMVNELIQAMVDMDTEAFERTVSVYISQKGIELTVLQVIFPFLERTGILWESGHINPSQEHLVTNLIRQKLIVAIETTVPVKQSTRRLLLYLPEGEYHELGLLFMYYLLKSRGVPTIYLGANVPVKDVGYVVDLKKADIAFIHLTGASPGFNVEKLLLQIRQFTGTIKTVLSGEIPRHYKKLPPSCVEFKRSMTEVMSFLTTL